MNRMRGARHPATELGSAAVPFVIALPVMLGMMALALDLSYQYTRKSELQQIADGIALAAARELNGTNAGVTAAKNKAYLVAKDSLYGFHSAIIWNPDALSLATGVDGVWKDVSSISSDAAAAGLLFAKADTSKLSGLDSAPGTLDTLFAGILGMASATTLNALAVAGPTTVQATPLAICALDLNLAGTRINPGAANETTEYGFRRGVSYNLLDLSPAFTTPQVYLANPVDAGSATNNVAHFGAAYVKQFFCNGTMAYRSVQANSKLHVIPLTLDIKDWLNARFNDFTTGDHCDKNLTPAGDIDIREYTGNYSYWYMGAPTAAYPAYARSTLRTVGTGKVTFPDLVATDPGNPAPAIPQDFGPLWTYSRPVPSGGGSFSFADWPKLYTAGGVSVPAGDTSLYPATGFPYQNSNHRVPVAGGTKERRVLNIPLLNCSAGNPGSPATVVGIGRFFMTAKATSTPIAVIPGEFAGIAPDGLASGSVALYK
jgi:hypothetical protein